MSTHYITLPVYHPSIPYLESLAQYKQIGNAVPVNLAYHIGRCLVAMLENYFDPLSMTILPETQI